MSRWTIFLASHDTERTRTLEVSGAVLALAGAAVVALVAAALAGLAVVVSQSVHLSRVWLLERTHTALAAEVARLDRRVATLSDSLAVLSRHDNEARLVAGLDSLSPDVELAGIGGPAGVWPERDRLLADGGAVGRLALGVHTRLDALIRQADIVAASFRQAGDSLSAHARQLEATPCIMPTPGFISSVFTSDRFHPILHVDLPHEGVDIVAADGARVLAPAAGRVMKVGLDEGYGLMVVIDHGYGLETRYAHLSSAAVRVGEAVGRGDLLGFVGSTGLSTGPHLHYEVRLNGRPVDPLTYILPADFSD